MTVKLRAKVGAKMGRLIGLVVVALLAFVGWRLWVVLDKTGSLRTLRFTEGVPCRPVAGAIGAEDVAIDHATGLVYVSALDRHRWITDKTVRGLVGVFSLTRGDSTVTDLTMAPAAGAPEKFAPHGLSLYVGADGKKTLAVINHADGEAVEIFDVVDPAPTTPNVAPTLVHRRTVKDPLFRNLNDVALVGPDAFYATNDHYYTPGLMRQIEDYLMLAKIFAVYFDGAKAMVAAKGLTYANGIAVSQDGKRVFVAETTRNVVRTYDRNAQTGDLTLAPAPWGKFDVGTGADNIDVAADGSLFVGAHPKLFALLKHFKDPSKLSPSEAVRLTPGEKGWTRKTVFLDSGKRISGMSVAARDGSNLVLGSILGKDVLVCPYTEGEFKVDIDLNSPTPDTP